MASDVVNAAHSDGQNQVFSQLGVIGTLGTADTKGTALTLPAAVDPQTGAWFVKDLNSSSGTTPVSGTVAIGDGGTIVANVLNLPIVDALSVAVVDNSGNQIVQMGGKQYAQGEAVAANGTVTVVGASRDDALSALGPTEGDASTLSVDGSGALWTHAFTPGTINAGTINASTVNVGSVSGRGANAAATVGFPVLVAGMDAGGTAYTLLTDNTGALQITTSTGDIPGGTLDVLSNVTNGTIRVTAGTVGGAAATAAALSGNPLPIGGVDAGGSVYGLLTDTDGVLQINGTVATGGAGTQPVSIIDGTVTNVGTIANIGKVHNAGTIAGGTLGILTDGTVRIAAGSIAVTAGTIGAATINTVGTLSNLVAGTIQNSGTTTGVGVVSNLTAGSINVIAGTVNSGTINAGTVRLYDGADYYESSVRGTLTATDAAATINISGASSVGIQISGTYTASMIPEITVNGTDWVRTEAWLMYDGTLSYPTNVLASNAMWNARVGGMKQLRVRASSYSDGTVYVDLRASSGVSAQYNRTMLVSSVGDMLNIDSSGALLAYVFGTVARGTINAGTINSGTINAGTINSGTINTGTINSATINAGTIRNDGRPARNILTFGTVFGNSGSANSTIVGSAAVGAGTSIWIQDFSIINHSTATSVDTGLSFGTILAGSPSLFRGLLPPGGGIQKTFPKPVNAGMTNFDLTAYASAGTCGFNVSYFISA